MGIEIHTWLAAARKVATFFDDSDQEDCFMHVVSLCMLYALGMKENTVAGAVATPGLVI